MQMLVCASYRCMVCKWLAQRGPSKKVQPMLNAITTYPALALGIAKLTGTAAMAAVVLAAAAGMGLL